MSIQQLIEVQKFDLRTPLSRESDFTESVEGLDNFLVKLAHLLGLSFNFEDPFSFLVVHFPEQMHLDHPEGSRAELVKFNQKFMDV